MRSTMKTAIILSMLALMCNIDTNAQNTIEGRVTDKETRQPLESATVIIQHTADATVINYTLTDTDGRFRLTVSSPQSVKLGVLYMGYKSAPAYHLNSPDGDSARTRNHFAERGSNPPRAYMGPTGYAEI